MMLSVSAKTRAFDGAKLRAAREARQWSPGRLSVVVGKALSSIYSWESDVRSPEPGTIVALAEALEIPPGDLLRTPPEAWSLYELRITKGLTQREVADRIGSNLSRVSQFEGGITPLEPAFTTALSELYGTTEADIAVHWQRGRNRLITDDV